MSDVTAKLAEALRAICAEQDAQQGYATIEAYDKAREALAAYEQAQADLSDPGYDVEVLREHVRHLERRVRELAAPVAQAEPWQPIDTAPKDGSTIMLWEKYESEPFFGYWWEGRSRWRASTTHYDTDGNACVIDRIYSKGVTHWMPLPQPPKENKHG